MWVHSFSPHPLRGSLSHREQPSYHNAFSAQIPMPLLPRMPQSGYMPPTHPPRLAWTSDKGGYVNLVGLDEVIWEEGCGHKRHIPPCPSPNLQPPHQQTLTSRQAPVSVPSGTEAFWHCRWRTHTDPTPIGTLGADRRRESGVSDIVSL
jgi:hypothetical protein